MEKKRKKRVAVLALQGAFIEHEKMFKSLGAEVLELRQKSDLQENFDALVLPGGESTVQGKLLKDLAMLAPLKERIQNGMPVLATCAGMILLAEHLEADQQKYFSTLPVTVKRNAYGRQLGSFFMKGNVTGLPGDRYPMEFIRAPFVTRADKNVEVLAVDDKENIVGVRYGKQFAFAFHPELTKDLRIHQMFLSQIEKADCA